MCVLTPTSSNRPIYDNFTPAVALTDSAFTTVGGTLSAGGFGSSSHRFGAQTTHVESLEVVTASGDVVFCSRSDEAWLFDAVRGGQGQFGVITRAWLRLRPCASRVCHYHLRYLDLGRLAADLHCLVDRRGIDHLRLQLRPHVPDAMLRVGTEYESTVPVAESIFDGLGFASLGVFRDTDDVGRAGLVPDDLLPRTRFHPWRDWLLPWSALPELVLRPPVPLDWLRPPPMSWVGCYFVCAGSLDAPLIVRPRGSRLFSYSILPVFERETQAASARERLEHADRVIRGLGGVAYVSGATGYGPAQWRAHFGTVLHDHFVALQRDLDPHGLLRRPGLPISS